MRILVATRYPEHRKYLNKMLVTAMRELNPALQIDKIYTDQQSYARVLPLLRRNKGMYTHVFLWNGSMPDDLEPLEEMKKMVEVIYFEAGWFPGRPVCSMYADPKGINAKSSIRDIDVDKLEWNPPHVHTLLWDAMCSETMPMYPYEDAYVARLDPGYIFVPLQLPNDTNIWMNSPHFKKMEDFVEFCLDVFKDTGKQVVFKKHPRDKRKYPGHVLLNGNIHGLVKKSCAVVGINSTVLVEALMHGKPVASVGLGLLTGLGVHLECHENKFAIRNILDWEPPRDRINELIHHLYYHRQMHLTSVEDLKECLEHNEVLTPILLPSRSSTL